MQLSRCSNSHRHHIRRLLGVTLLTSAALTGSAFAADKPAGAPAKPAKPTSSCVACHTDAEKLKVEAAKVPAPPASALQAGKG